MAYANLYLLEIEINKQIEDSLKELGIKSFQIIVINKKKWYQFWK